MTSELLTLSTMSEENGRCVNMDYLGRKAVSYQI